MYMIMRAVQILALVESCWEWCAHSGLGKFCGNDYRGVFGRKRTAEKRRGDKRTDHGGK